MTRKLVCLSLAAIALAGCQTTRTIIVPCVGKDQVLPAEPDKVAPRLTGKADEDSRILAGGLLRWQFYGRSMREIVDNCRAS